MKSDLASAFAPKPIKPRQKIPMGCGLVLALPFVVAGLVICGVGVHQMWQGHAALSWPQAKGKITRSGVKTGRKSATTDIHYSYLWDGKTLEGASVRAGGNTAVNGRTAHQREDLANYPVGKEVPVFVDPSDPGNALLEPGVTWWPSLLFPCFGLVFAALPLWSVLRTTKKAADVGFAPSGDATDPADSGAPARDGPAWLEWSAVKCSYSSFRKQQLQVDDAGVARVVSSQNWVGYAMAAFLVAMGAVPVCIGANVASGFLKTLPSGWAGVVLGVFLGVFSLVFVGVGLLFVLIGLFLAWPAGKGPTFDPLERTCRHLRRASGGPLSGRVAPLPFARRDGEISFVDVQGLQLLAKKSDVPAGGGQTIPMTGYQLNLVLKDQTRRNVMAHADLSRMEADARTLARILGVSVWTSV